MNPTAPVPDDFPREPLLRSVPGAQPKLAVRIVNGAYTDGADERREQRHAICDDLAIQLLAYYRRKQLEPHGSVGELRRRVEVGLRAKAAGWGLSPAEVDWTLTRLWVLASEDHVQSDARSL
jgi:hypothetical protein